MRRGYSQTGRLRNTRLALSRLLVSATIKVDSMADAAYNQAHNQKQDQGILHTTDLEFVPLVHACIIPLDRYKVPARLLNN